MGLAVGEILEGKVTGITKFGAFVALPEGKSGMVHISEVANSYVNDIKDFIKIEDTVRVKVINIDDQGRINLSIKRVQEQPRAEQAQSEFRPRPERRPPQRNFAQQPRENKPRDPGSMTFEDKLKMFMADSESRMADIRHNTDRKNGSRRRKGFAAKALVRGNRRGAPASRLFCRKKMRPPERTPMQNKDCGDKDMNGAW